MRFPDKIIWLQKEYFKPAYRWLHAREKTVAGSAAQLKLNGQWYIIILLRLPFDSFPCPNSLCLLSDIITDIIVNDLVSYEN